MALEVFFVREVRWSAAGLALGGGGCECGLGLFYGSGWGVGGCG